MTNRCVENYMIICSVRRVIGDERGMNFDGTYSILSMCQKVAFASYGCGRKPPIFFLTFLKPPPLCHLLKTNNSITPFF
jgi:hypothetical protein